MFKYVASSKKLISLQKKIFISHTLLDVDECVKDIETIKRITFSRIERANVTICLQSISNVHYVMKMIESVKKQSFDWNNLSHFELIDKYWNAMFPNVRRQKRTISEEWGELGFQGNDPSTDFRGMGLLGLLQLEYFASNRMTDAKKVLGDSMHPRRYYPFSATGINITAFVMELLRENRLHTRMMKYLEKYCLDSRSSQMSSDSFSALSMCEGEGANEVVQRGCSSFHDLYCEVYIAFNDLWVHRDPANIMAFASIFDEVKKDFRHRYPAPSIAKGKL